MSRAVERAGGFGVEEGTVLMSDIRGYSTFSEFMDPATVMSQLNTYFGSVQEILDRHGNSLKVLHKAGRRRRPVRRHVRAAGLNVK